MDIAASDVAPYVWHMHSSSNVDVPKTRRARVTFVVPCIKTLEHRPAMPRIFRLAWRCFGSNAIYLIS